MADPAATADLRRWVETWKQAAPELAAIRQEEVRTGDNPRVIELLSGAFTHALTLPMRTTSGLVAMQRILQKSAPQMMWLFENLSSLVRKCGVRLVTG